MITEHKQRDSGRIIESTASKAVGPVSSDLDPTSTAALLPSYSKVGHVYFFASDHEADYPDNIARIEVQGGTYLGIAGGMEHNFAYWVASQPEKIVLYDVNPWAIKLAKAKCELLLSSESYDDFSKRFDRVFKGREHFQFTSISPDDFHELVLEGVKMARTSCFLSPRCARDNGWDKPEEYHMLKQIIAANIIEFIHGDLLNDSMAYHKDLSLIFLSDIFGIGANHDRRPVLVAEMERQLKVGNIRQDAQIIDGANSPTVLLVNEYARSIANAKSSQPKVAFDLPSAALDYLRDKYYALASNYPGTNGCVDIATELTQLLGDTPIETVNVRRKEVWDDGILRTTVLEPSRYQDVHWSFHRVVISQDCVLDPAFSPKPIPNDVYLDQAFPNQNVKFYSLEETKNDPDDAACGWELGSRPEFLKPE